MHRQKTHRKKRKRVVAKLNPEHLELAASELGYDYGAFISMCGGKTPYTTEENAERVAKRRERAGSRKLRVYRCPICKRWHMTHTECSS